MVGFGTSPQPKCPKCGGPRAMVSWVGDEPPLCAACAGATVVGLSPDLGGGRDREHEYGDIDDLLDELRVGMEDEPCAHKQLEKSLPLNQRGGPHMLVCNCPKCRPIC